MPSSCMNPWTRAPIIELRPDPGVGLIAVVPAVGEVFSYAGSALAETLAALLAFTVNARPDLCITPQFDPTQTTELQAKLLTMLASDLHRTDRKYRGRTCPDCGYPT